jgi:hypothetical protein
MPWNWSEIFPLAAVFHGSWRIQIEQCREHLRKHLVFDLEINPVCTSPYVQIREASHLKAARTIAEAEKKRRAGRTEQKPRS